MKDKLSVLFENIDRLTFSKNASIKYSELGKVAKKWPLSVLKLNTDLKRKFKIYIG